MLEIDTFIDLWGSRNQSPLSVSTGPYKLLREQAYSGDDGNPYT